MDSMKCGMCAAGFGDQLKAADSLTAAAVLVLGCGSLAAARQKVQARAEQRAVPGATSYCASCMRCTWLASEACDGLQDALVAHCAEYDRCVRMLEAMRRAELRSK